MPNTAREMKDTTATATPKVSVIIPLYNHEHYVREAVCSVLEQTFQDFELLIINDGSTDKSEEVVKGISDKRIKYICQDNRGAAGTINRGVQLARGEFVSVLNSDDMYDIHRLEECLGIFEKDSSVSAVFSHLEFIDGEGKFIKYHRGAEENWTYHQPETSFKGEHNIVLDLLAGNFLITTSNLFCRKNAFERVGYFSNLKYAHDYEFFLKLCHHYKTYVVQRPLLKYRVHGSNTLKEDDPAVNFEVGLVLSDFFIKNSLKNIIPECVREKNIYEVMIKFYNSLNTYRTDRLVMVLLLFGGGYGKEMGEFTRELGEDPANSFKESCIASLKTSVEGWAQWRKTNERLIAKEKELQEGWIQWRELNEQLVAKEKELQVGWMQWRETNERLVARDRELQMVWEQWRDMNERLVAANEHIQTLLNSRSYRLGLLLSWPFRKLLGRN